MLLLEPKYGWNLTEPFLRFAEHLCRSSKYHHDLYLVSFQLSRAEFSDIVKLDLQLVFFQLSILRFVREIDEYRVVNFKFLVRLVPKDS